MSHNLTFHEDIYNHFECKKCKYKICIDQNIRKIYSLNFDYYYVKELTENNIQSCEEVIMFEALE